MFARNVLALGALAIVSVTAALAFGPQRKVMPKPKPKPPMKIVFASVKPILDAKCVMCHSGPHPKHNLLLNSYANVMKGDKESKVVIPGNPAGSRLSKAIHHAKGVSAMPPKAMLSAGDIAKIDAWIKAG